MFTAWVFTAFWNLISSPVGFLGVRAPAKMQPDGGFQVTLSCVRR